MLKSHCQATEPFADGSQGRVWLKIGMRLRELEAMDGPFVLLTEEEYEAQVRKPQVSAEVIAQAREALNYYDEVSCTGPRGFAVRHALDALLAAVEAAPEEKRLTEEECWAKLYDALDAANPPNQGSGVVKLWVNSNAWGGQRLFFVAHSFNTPGTGMNADPLAAIEYVAACKPKPPAPDFSAMSPDELRAWLDERGRRSVWRPHNALWCAALNALTGTTIAEVRGLSDEPAALRALCRKVAAKEAS
jgi:hypothetical protein